MEKSEERPDTGAEEERDPKDTPAGDKPAAADARAVTPEAESTAEPVAAPAGERGRGGPRHYLSGALVSAAVLAFGLALFAAGFATHSLLDNDVDLKPIEDKLAALDQRTAQIQDTLGGAVGEAGDEGAAAAASPAAAISEASDDDPSWGPEDASVVMVEFADFQCPYCARHSQQTMPSIRESYGDKVRYVYRDFPLTSIHQFAQKAAEGGQCAQDQGMFWEFHDLLFENQGALADSDLKSYAEQIGADTGEFNDCLDSGKHAPEVLLDLQDGRTAGITGTPAFVINGVLVSGAQPFEQFRQVIDQALAQGE